MFTIYIRKGIQKADTISEDYELGNIILYDGNIIGGKGDSKEDYDVNPDNWKRFVDIGDYIYESFICEIQQKQIN